MPLRTSIFYEVVSFIGVILTSILIGLIITKTPVAMKQFKIYLLLYSCHLEVLLIVCALYAPSVLHPYIIFYPMGIAKNFSPNISAIIFVFIFFSAMSMYDCIIAMIMERYFAMKNLHNNSGKIAIRVFLCLQGLAYGYLIFTIFVIYFPPLNNYFLISPNPEIIESLFEKNLEDGIILDSLIIFQNPKANRLPPFTLLLCGTMGSRIILIIIFLILNAFKSRQLSNHAISETLQKHTSMLIKMIFFQLTGIITFIGIPMIAVLSIASFAHQSNSYVNYIFSILNCFGIYDPLVTIICIKPYRMTIAKWFKKCFGWKNNAIVKSAAAAVSPLPPPRQNRLHSLSIRI